MYPVEYEVHSWNEVADKEDIVHGITFGENYSDAMYNIEKYYGDTLISVKLFMCEEVENPIYEFEINSDSDNFHGMFKFGDISLYEGF